jgi:DNA-binding CsgD family transcriptional regulator
VPDDGQPHKLGIFGNPSYPSWVATEQQRARCRERLERLSESQLDSDAVRHEAILELQRTIGFDRWCWPLADPETAVPLSGLAEHDYGPNLPRALELEFAGGDFVAKHVVARDKRAVASLSAETGGDLPRSRRWDEVLRPVGIGDIAVAACRDELGCWGWIEAYRDKTDRAFEEEELELLADVARQMAPVLRRSRTQVRNPAKEAAATGVLVLDGHLRVTTSTEAACSWIAALPAAPLFTAWAMLPPVVYPVVTMARTTGHAHALEQTADGRWLMIEASAVADAGDVAVTFRGATPAETFVVLCRAYALTRRERDIVRTVIVGLDTRAIAERLFISRHTVQDHLKSIFDKTGVRSRRELLATFNSI